MIYTAKWWAILFSYKEGILLELFTPTKIKIDKSSRKIVVTKRDYNLITNKSTIFWIKDIRSFQIEKTLFGCNIHIKSRGNYIVCHGFSSKDTNDIQLFFNQLR